MTRSTRRFVLLPAAAVATAAFVVSCTDTTTPVAPPPASAPGLRAAVVDAYDGGQIHGAIFTTTPNGGTVNANVQYTDKRQVYLDGGPKGNAPITAAGLPDGLYVFQITDPPGKVLLSDDPAKCRVVQVAGGIVTHLVAPSDLPAQYGSLTNYYGNGNPGTACSIADAPTPPTAATAADFGASGHHDTNVDVDHGAQGAIVVQMMPFLDTPNPGGVYKAWMTPLQTYVAKGGQLNAQTASSKVQGKVVGYARDPGFAPPLNKVKTDNFKVTQNPPFVTIDKFVDANRDGLLAGDAAFAGAGGWPVTVTEPVDGGTVTNEYFTPTGNIGVPQNTTVMVCERILSTWNFSYVYVNGVKVSPLGSPTTDGDGNPIVCVNVTSGTGSTIAVAFGNSQLPSISITKTPASQTLSAGAPFSWVVTLSNAGPGVALAATIDDPLPVVTGVSYALGSSSPSGASCALNTGVSPNVLHCGPLDLAAGQSITATINATTTPNQGCVVGGFLNTATGKSTGVSDVQASARVTLNCPSLQILKSPATQTVVSGDPINWTVTVSNTGLGIAYGVHITDNLPAVQGGSYSTSTSGCSISNLVLSCNAGNIAAGGSFAAAIRLQTSSGEFCGVVTNTATASGTNITSIVSNQVSATLTGCGRMTGGSGQVQITDDTFLTSGFTIHCDIVLSNNLEINWPNNKWHLSKPITYARCIDDPAVTPGQPDAPFDTFVGRAVGELNGVPGSTVEFTFVDAGEPGKIADKASILVKDKFGTTVLNISNVPIKGNLQAHEDQPHQ